LILKNLNRVLKNNGNTEWEDVKNPVTGERVNNLWFINWYIDCCHSGSAKGALEEWAAKKNGELKEYDAAKLEEKNIKAEFRRETNASIVSTNMLEMNSYVHFRIYCSCQAE
jgi:hypothetical protein